MKHDSSKPAWKAPAIAKYVPYRLRKREPQPAAPAATAGEGFTLDLLNVVLAGHELAEEVVAKADAEVAAREGKARDT